MERDSSSHYETWSLLRLLQYSDHLSKLGNGKDRKIKNKINSILSGKGEINEFDIEFSNLFIQGGLNQIGTFIEELLLGFNLWKIHYIKKHSLYNRLPQLIDNYFKDILKKIESHLTTSPLSSYPNGYTPQELLKQYDLLDKHDIYKNKEVEKNIIALIDRYNVPFDYL